MKRILLSFLVLGLAACASVLGLRRPGEIAAFEHRPHVMEGVACTECHAGIPKAGDTGALNLPTNDKCLSCHTEPHDPNDCRGCHSNGHNVERAVMAKHYLRFSHEAHLPHVKGNCARCHVDIAKAEVPLLPTMATCLRCHQDEWDVRDCNACHVHMETEGSRPESHVFHGPDYVRDHAVRAGATPDLCRTCHTEASCARCHGASVPALPERLNFDTPGMSGIHRAGFRARHADEARSQPGLCVTCHAQSSCAECHAQKGLASDGTAKRSPHPPGWIGFGRGANSHGTAARRDPAGCASCHGGAGEMLCVSCHKVGGVGGTIHPPGWTSPRSKAEAPCRHCHGVLP